MLAHSPNKQTQDENNIPFVDYDEYDAQIWKLPTPNSTRFGYVPFLLFFCHLEWGRTMIWKFKTISFVCVKISHEFLCHEYVLLQTRLHLS